MAAADRRQQAAALDAEVAEEREPNGVGIQLEDMRVIATMVDPRCLASAFSIRRNRRALLNVFPLGVFSTNHRALVPLFGNVARLVVVGNADEGLLALALSFLADCAAGRSEYREIVAMQEGLLVAACHAMADTHKAFSAVSAACLVRNAIVSCTEASQHAVVTIVDGEVEPALINLLVQLNARSFEDDVTPHSAETPEDYLHSAQECICGAICNVASLGPDFCERLVEAGAIRALLRVMSSRATNEVQAAAADALGNMAISNSVGETLLRIRESSSLFSMATHEADLKVSKSASHCLANITALSSLNKHRLESTGVSFLQRLNGADVRALVRRRTPVPDDQPRDS